MQIMTTTSYFCSLNLSEQEGNGPVVRAGRQYTEAVDAVGVKSDFKFKLTDHNYHVSIALWHLLVTIHKITATAVYLKWPLRLLTASEVNLDLKIELSDLNYILFHVSLGSDCLH